MGIVSRPFPVCKDHIPLDRCRDSPSDECHQASSAVGLTIWWPGGLSCPWNSAASTDRLCDPISPLPQTIAHRGEIKGQGVAFLRATSAN